MFECLGKGPPSFPFCLTPRCRGWSHGSHFYSMKEGLKLPKDTMEAWNETTMERSEITSWWKHENSGSSHSRSQAIPPDFSIIRTNTFPPFLSLSQLEFGLLFLLFFLFTTDQRVLTDKSRPWHPNGNVRNTQKFNAQLPLSVIHQVCPFSSYFWFISHSVLLTLLNVHNFNIINIQSNWCMSNVSSTFHMYHLQNFFPIYFLNP